MGLNFRTNNTWVTATAAWFRDNTTWHQAKEIWLNVNKTWVKVFGGKNYVFTFGNTIYASTNGYLSFDNTNGTYYLPSTLGRVLDIFGADMQQNALYYAADSTYWYYRWHGQRLTGTANEVRLEVWIPTGGQYAYVYLEAFVSGMNPSPTAYYVDGSNTGYSTLNSSRVIGGKYFVYFSNVGAGLTAFTPWGYNGNARLSYPWVQLPNSSVVASGVTFPALDEGYSLVPTAKGGSPGQVTTLTASSIGATGTTVTWYAPSDVGMSFITSYDWALSADDGATYGASTNIAASNTASAQASITLGTLTSDTKYRVRVRANNYMGYQGTWTVSSQILFSAPGSFTYQAADGTATPSIPTISEYRGYDSPSWGNESIIDVGTGLPTNATDLSVKAWGGCFDTAGGTTTTETSPALNVSIAVFNIFPDSAWTPSSNTTGGDYSGTIKNSNSTYGSWKAYTTNTNRKVRIYWSASTNAGSYRVAYTISGAGGANGNYNSLVAGPSPATELIVTLGNVNGTVAVTGVTAYSSTDGTGSSTTAGSLYYNPISGFGSSSITPTNKTNSTSVTTVGPYKVRYYPSVSLSSPSGLTSSGGTVNWTSSNQASWTITGDLSRSSNTTTASSTSASFTGLSANTYYNYTITVFSSDSHSAANTADATTNSTYRLKTTVAQTVNGTPVVTGDNALTVGGTFSWTCTGNPAPVYRVTIGYNATNAAGPFTTKYQQPSAALTTSNGLTITSIRPGYDIGTGWSGAGYYRCTVQALNSATGATVTSGSNVTYMS